MNLDEEAIGARGDSSARERKNFIAASCAMARGPHNWEMASAPHGRDHAQIERVARVVRERANAALAEDHVVIAFGHDVFSGHQKFVEGRGHAALQEHGLTRAASNFEKRKILHVAGADLNYVRIFLDELERLVV